LHLDEHVLLAVEQRLQGAGRLAPGFFLDVVLGEIKALLGLPVRGQGRSEEHTSELQSLTNLVCRLLLEKKKKTTMPHALLSHHTTPHSPSSLPLLYFNPPPTTEIYTLSLHDALPISSPGRTRPPGRRAATAGRGTPRPRLLP